MRGFGIATAVTLAVATVAAVPASAATIVIAPTSVSATNPAGSIVYTGLVNGTDSVLFRALGEAFLQFNAGKYEYGTNAAGVLTTGSTNTGYANTPGGFEVYSAGGQTYTYGALLATLTQGGTSTTVQVFPTNGKTGVGSSNPDSIFVYGGTLTDLFGTVTTGAGTLSLSVADTGYFDNAGSFSVTSVPEPAAWLMMIVGFGAIGAVARRRRSTERAFA